MSVILIRVVIVYVSVTVSMRIMGKRQVGELKTTELFITILMSEIGAIPVQNREFSVLTCISAVFVLVAFEVLCSAISIKSSGFRRLLEGNSLMVVRDGTVDLEQLKKLRFSLDDLLEALRCKNVFDITEVQYAKMETTGKISYILKPEYRNATPKDLQLTAQDNGIPCTVVYDGKVVRDESDLCNMSEEKLKSLMQKNNLVLESLMLMTVDKSGEINVIIR